MTLQTAGKVSRAGALHLLLLVAGLGEGAASGIGESRKVLRGGGGGGRDLIANIPADYDFDSCHTVACCEDCFSFPCSTFGTSSTLCNDRFAACNLSFNCGPNCNRVGECVDRAEASVTNHFDRGQSDCREETCCQDECLRLVGNPDDIIVNRESFPSCLQRCRQAIPSHPIGRTDVNTITNRQTGRRLAAASNGVVTTTGATAGSDTSQDWAFRSPRAVLQEDCSEDQTCYALQSALSNEFLGTSLNGRDSIAIGTLDTEFVDDISRELLSQYVFLFIGTTCSSEELASGALLCGLIQAQSTPFPSDTQSRWLVDRGDDAGFGVVFSDTEDLSELLVDHEFIWVIRESD